jgi:hypothetical protein
VPRVHDGAGFRVSIYADDHPPPHVHVYVGDRAAKLEVATGRVLAGSVPARHLRSARQWIAANRAVLLRRWDELNERR